MRENSPVVQRIRIIDYESIDRGSTPRGATL